VITRRITYYVSKRTLKDIKIKIVGYKLVSINLSYASVGLEITIIGSMRSALFVKFNQIKPIQTNEN